MFHVCHNILYSTGYSVTNESIVGFNIRTALNDTVLPTGGGPAGNDRIGVLKGTHVGTSTLPSFPRISPPALALNHSLTTAM